VNKLSSEAIELQREMDQIRCDLYGDMNDLRADAKQLTDYRYHVGRHPWIALAAAAAAGFVIIPQRTQKLIPDTKTMQELIKQNQLIVQTKSEVNQKKGLIATGVSLLVAAGVKAAINYASQTATAKLAAYGQPQPAAPAERVSYPTRPR